MDNSAKVNDLEIALWPFKNVQNFFCSTIKNSRTSINPLLNLNFHFAVVAVVDITYIEYFLSVFLSSFIKIFENLWKWFEFIHYSFLVNNTCVSTLSLYAHVIAIKMGVSCIYAYSLFVWDSRDIRGLYFSNFSSEKYLS